MIRSSKIIWSTSTIHLCMGGLTNSSCDCDFCNCWYSCAGWEAFNSDMTDTCSCYSGWHSFVPFVCCGFGGDANQVWAIGTGLTATPEVAQSVHAFIRSCLAQKYGDAVASGVRIQYGERLIESTFAAAVRACARVFLLTVYFKPLVKPRMAIPSPSYLVICPPFPGNGFLCSHSDSSTRNYLTKLQSRGLYLNLGPYPFKWSILWIITKYSRSWNMPSIHLFMVFVVFSAQFRQ